MASQIQKGTQSSHVEGIKACWPNIRSKATATLLPPPKPNKTRKTRVIAPPGEREGPHMGDKNSMAIKNIPAFIPGNSSRAQSDRSGSLQRYRK